MAVYPFSQGNTADATLDAIAVELEAMQVIATALAGIRDPQIRQRVLQWANERFTAGPTARPPVTRPDTTEKIDESGLDVEPLYDFFEQPRAAAQSGAVQATTVVITDAPAPVAPARELRAVRDAREPREEAALDTMVKGFASELQRLAVEWQTA